MTRDDVIYALERCTCTVADACVDCPMWEEGQSDSIACRARLMREALALLKQEPKRGRWITYPECLAYEGAYSEDHLVCSECESVWSIMDNDTETFRCCPNCGARMEED